MSLSCLAFSADVATFHLLMIFWTFCFFLGCTQDCQYDIDEIWCYLPGHIQFSDTCCYGTDSMEGPSSSCLPLLHLHIADRVVKAMLQTRTLLESSLLQATSHIMFAKYLPVIHPEDLAHQQKAAKVQRMNKDAESVST